MAYDLMKSLEHACKLWTVCVLYLVISDEVWTLISDKVED